MGRQHHLTRERVALATTSSRLAVFDLDRTLLPGSSLAHLEVEHLVSALGRIDLSDARAYADSISDLPLEAVGVPVAVNPDPDLLRHAEQHRWPVLRLS